MKYRCKYRLVGKVITGAEAYVAAGVFDDADHGTTIEFTGDMLPLADEKVYDDTPAAEKLDPNVNFKAVLDVSTTSTDSDGDGIPDIDADGVETALINIQKKDSAGVDMVAAGDNDAFFVEANAGMDVASGSLVNGAASVNLQTSTEVGRLADIGIRSSTPGLIPGAIQVKYI